LQPKLVFEGSVKVEDSLMVLTLSTLAASRMDEPVNPTRGKVGIEGIITTVTRGGHRSREAIGRNEAVVIRVRLSGQGIWIWAEFSGCIHGRSHHCQCYEKESQTHVKTSGVTTLPDWILQGRWQLGDLHTKNPPRNPGHQTSQS
jgi:hypothetical protein